MLSYLLTPFIKGVNTEAIGLNAIIFDALCGSLILSSLLYTLGNTYNIYVLNKSICFHVQATMMSYILTFVFMLTVESKISCVHTYCNVNLLTGKMLYTGIVQNVVGETLTNLVVQHSH